jgi:hypothetical protein
VAGERLASAIAQRGGDLIVGEPVVEQGQGVVAGQYGGGHGRTARTISAKVVRIAVSLASTASKRCSIRVS